MENQAVVKGLIVAFVKWGMLMGHLSRQRQRKAHLVLNANIQNGLTGANGQPHVER